VVLAIMIVGGLGGGDRGGVFLDPLGDPLDLGGQHVDLVQEHLGDLGVVVVEEPGQRLDERRVLGAHPAARRPGRHLGVPFTGDQRLDHGADRQGGHPAAHCGHLDEGVFQ
jgi:hypothetical protein